MTDRTSSSLAPPHDIGTLLLSREQCFFERSFFSAQEAPDGIVRDHNTSFRLEVFQAMQRQMRYFLDLLENEGAMRCQAAPAIAAELGGRRATCLADAPGPLHDR